MKRTVIGTVLFIALAAVAAGQQLRPFNGPPAKPLAETLRTAGNFKTFLGLLEQAGIRGDAMREPTTIFAPNDAAFARLPKGALAALRKDPARLRAFLLGHMVPGRLTVKAPSGPADSARTFRAADGSELSLIWTAGRNGANSLRVNGKARVGRFQDVLASDYPVVVHEIDAVLMGDGSVVPAGAR